MKKEELQKLKILLEKEKLSQLDFSEIKRNHSDFNLEGIDLSQLVLPSTEEKKTTIDSYINAYNCGIIRTPADLYLAQQVLQTDEERQENNILHLVIGEDIPANAPKKFQIVKLYIKDKDDSLNLYADILLPYLINHWEFLDIKDDPRYFFKEGYDPKTHGCKYICEIKPLGKMKGVYRILNGQSIKIMSIEPLCELENNMKVHTLVKKNK